MLSFGTLLAEHLQRRNMSGGSFARTAKANQSHLSKILRGVRPPPVDSLEHWADVLELSESERLRFRIAGQLGHCPVELQRALAIMAEATARYVREPAGDPAREEACVIAELLLHAAPQSAKPKRGRPSGSKSTDKPAKAK